MKWMLLLIATLTLQQSALAMVTADDCGYTGYLEAFPSEPDSSQAFQIKARQIDFEAYDAETVIHAPFIDVIQYGGYGEFGVPLPGTCTVHDIPPQPAGAYTMRFYTNNKLITSAPLNILPVPIGMPALGDIALLLLSFSTMLVGIRYFRHANTEM